MNTQANYFISEVIIMRVKFLVQAFIPSVSLFHLCFNSFWIAIIYLVVPANYCGFMA